MPSKISLKRSAAAKPVKRSGMAHKRVLLKAAGEHGNLKSFNDRLQARFKRAAAAAKDDPAFVLYVSTALNGRTEAVTGWVPGRSKRKGKKSVSDKQTQA